MHYKQIHIGDKNVLYQLKVSSKAKRIRLTIYYDGRLIVTLPKHLEENSAEIFIQKKASWVLEKLRDVSYSKNKIVKAETLKHFQNFRDKARECILSRINYFNSFYKFHYNKVTVRRQKARWGSCSEYKNLSFNYRLFFLPKYLSDYIIVHELCHLGELNHSKNFWKLVERTIPEYKKIIEELNNYSFSSQ